MFLIFFKLWETGGQTQKKYFPNAGSFARCPATWSPIQFFMLAERAQVHKQQDIGIKSMSGSWTQPLCNVVRASSSYLNCLTKRLPWHMQIQYKTFPFLWHHFTPKKIKVVLYYVDLYFALRLICLPRLNQVLIHLVITNVFDCYQIESFPLNQ